MPVTLTDPLDLSLREVDTEIPVSAQDPALGAVSLRLREIPYAKWRSLEAELIAAQATTGQAWEALRKAPTVQNAEALAKALDRGREADLTLLRWGVCGHRGEDFLHAGAPIPFESVEEEYLGAMFRLASPRMVRLYTLAGGGRSADLGTLVPQISRAVGELQRGRVRTPAEVWAEAAKKAEAEE